jgi:hypothetical protein
LDFAGRIYRQLICYGYSRMRAATRTPSIKRIEIARVGFDNHLPRQMDKSLIQKGNSITALSLRHNQGAQRSQRTRSETWVRRVNPGEIAGFKKSLPPCSQLQLNCDALSRAGCPDKASKSSISAKPCESQALVTRTFFDLSSGYVRIA